MTLEATILVALIFLVALLYSSVGHAGASGYLAVMALFGLQQSEAKPTALMLNILVASITTWQFTRAGQNSWRMLWPFVVGSIPFAFFGGSITLKEQSYKLVVAFVLIVAGLRLLLPSPPKEDAIRRLPVWLAIPLGSAIGFLSGLTGTGGGIFLTPLLLFYRWSDAKVAAGVSAAFILSNSLAGLGGQLAIGQSLPRLSWTWLAAAGLGGLIGSHFGSLKFSSTYLRRLLGLALFIAASKLVVEGLRSRTILG